MRLTPQNLKDELDAALTSYFNEHITQFLNRLNIPQFNKGLLGALYYLEGKDLLINLFTFLLSEYGYKQLTDPHLFALAILYGFGMEPMEYELDGFGRNTRKIILDTGQKMMRAALDQKPIAEIFEKSGLRQCPGSVERIFQKQETKKLLKSCIASMIYNAIKSDEFQHPDSILKSLREKASQLPLIGSATIGLHLLFNGTFFSLSYLFRGKEHSEKTFTDWMGRHFSGKNLCNFISDKIVELIFDPSWPITILQIIESAINVLTTDGSPGQPNEQFIKMDLAKITDFLCHHFTKGTKLSLQGKIGKVVDYFSGDLMFQLFKESLKPSSPSLLEKSLTSNLPVIKELLLYTRVIDSFRLQMVGFEGDGKFWECFIRESLNQFVALEIEKGKLKSPSIKTQASSIRAKIVDELLSLDQSALRTKLSVAHEVYFMLENWVEMPTEEDEFVVVLPLNKVGIDTTS